MFQSINGMFCNSSIMYTKLFRTETKNTYSHLYFVEGANCERGSFLTSNGWTNRGYIALRILISRVLFDMFVRACSLPAFNRNQIIVTFQIYEKLVCERR
jgi:hypothetical protein